MSLVSYGLNPPKANLKNIEIALFLPSGKLESLAGDQKRDILGPKSIGSPSIEQIMHRKMRLNRLLTLRLSAIYSGIWIFLYFGKLSATAVCLGPECRNLSQETLLLGNLINPVLGEIYTDQFLESMGQSAVFQNINSSLVGGSRILNHRIGASYSMARANVKSNNLLFENTELDELPKQGIAASPAFSYGFNLKVLLPDLTGSEKWNVQIHFFPYHLSETNIPFLNIKNTDVSGKVYNSGIQLRYFPFFNPEGPSSPTWENLSFGFGLFHTNQEVFLYAYDRRPTQFRVDGDRRRWIGENNLAYRSNINTFMTDIRFSSSSERLLSVYGGLGLLYNSGITRIRVQRTAAISSISNPDDFGTTPSFIGFDLGRSYQMNKSDGFGIFGIQLNADNFSIILEYLRNQNSESASLGIHYLF